jgi:hypothetical protein
MPHWITPSPNRSFGLVAKATARSIPHDMGKGHAIVAPRLALISLCRPAAISPPGGCDMDLNLIQKTLPHEPFTSSSTECVNVNAVIPEQDTALLPVFVFVYGGGFHIGANAWPQKDLARLVKLSHDIGKPVIGVQIKCVRVFGCPDKCR